jgi:putative endonuclease
VQRIPSNPKHNKQIGAYGEQVVAAYLLGLGFTVIDRNNLKPWGEIDIIAKKEGIVHFVEVKTVSYETKVDLNLAVTHGTWRPEENVHASKLKKLSRAIESWLMEKRYNGKWQIDVAAVRIVPRETFATINIIENVIL